MIISCFVLVLHLITNTHLIETDRECKDCTPKAWEKFQVKLLLENCHYTEMHVMACKVKEIWMGICTNSPSPRHCQMTDIRSWDSSVEEAASAGMCHTYSGFCDRLLLSLRAVCLHSNFPPSASTLFYRKPWRTASYYLIKSPTKVSSVWQQHFIALNEFSSFVLFLEEDCCFQWKVQ